MSSHGFNANQFFDFDHHKHLLRLAHAISGKGKSAVHWTMSADHFSVHSHAKVWFVRKSSNSGGLHQKITRRLTDTSFDSVCRNISCPMCGAYQLEDWRDDLWGIKQNYPQRYLRIESPQQQIMVHFPNDHKVCNVNGSSWTAPCVSYFRVNHVWKSHWRSQNISKDAVWSNFNGSFMKPERVSFWDNTIWMKNSQGGHLRKVERVRQTYNFKASTRTPNVGIYWNKINFGNQRIDKPDGTTEQGGRKPPATCRVKRSHRWELYFLFDGSGSIGKANFHNMLKAGAELASDVLANKQNKVAAEVFSGRNRITTMNSLTSSYSTIKNWLDSQRFPSGGTPTHVALQRAQSWLNAKGTKGYQKHVIVFSDGVPNNVGATNHWAARLKSAGFRVSVVTITNNTTLKSQAHRWASKPKRFNLVNIGHFKTIATPEGRDNFVTQVSTKICKD